MKKTFTTIAMMVAVAAHAQFPTSGLFASYPLDNGLASDATGANHGTVTATQSAMNRNGVSNSSLYFNGSTAYVDLGSNSSWNLIDSDGITVSAWVNTVGSLSASLAGIVTRWAGNATADQFGLFLTQNTHYPFMAINPSSNNGVTGSTALTTNEWHHVVMTYNRTGGHHGIYLNGVQVFSEVISGLPGNPTNPVSVIIGAQAALAGSPTRYFRGYIDDVNIWSRPLTEAEVLALYLAEGGSTPCQVVAVTEQPQNAGICAGTSSATLSVAVAEPTASIQWQFNDGSGWGDMTGETGLTVEAAAAGQYRAKVTADCGTISYSDAATVASGGPSFVEPMPTNVWLCSEEPHVLLTANAAGEGITYQWRRNNAGEINTNQIDIPGATASTHEATEAEVFYTVVITACGVSETSDLIQISSFPSPTVTIFGNEPTTICNGQSQYLSSQASQSGSQIWEPGNVAWGSVTVSPTETTVYTVTHTTTLTGCTATASRTIIVAEPEIPVIIDNMGVLEFATAGFHSYNWQFEGVDIPFAGFETYTPTQSGSYTLRAVHQTPGVVNGCPVVSEPYNVLITGITSADGRNFSVSPNPFYAELTVTVKEPTVISLFNVLGEMVLTQPVNGRTTIATDALPAGMYFLRDADSSGVVRVVKQ